MTGLHVMFYSSKCIELPYIKLDGLSTEKMACNLWVNGWVFFNGIFTTKNPIASSFHCKLFYWEKNNIKKCYSTLKVAIVFFSTLYDVC
jgi:hypothetical protein